jgi:hypothetical protein
MEHELVQHYDTGLLAQRVDDPAVGVGIVADVVERDVRLRPPLARLCKYDVLDALAQRRQQ